MIIGHFMADAISRLQAAGVGTARLDTLVLIADALGKDKGWLLAHTEQGIPADVLKTLNQQVVLRTKRIPLAYIRGKQDFYGRVFAVSPDVLIPRPETEAVIECLKEVTPARGRLLDVGTGSGSIAVTATLETNAQVDACDISPAALQVAAHNAKNLGAKVDFFESDLLASATKKYDIIVANLPYVARSWHRSPETNAEPTTALFAADNGLAIIKRLIRQAPDHLVPNGCVVLEADPRQHAAITTYAAARSFATLTHKDFVVSFRFLPQVAT